MYFKLRINGKDKIYKYAKNAKKAAEKALNDQNTKTIALYAIQPHKVLYIPHFEYYKICANKHWFYYISSVYRGY